MAHPISKPKLLLVDDKPGNLLALEAVLGDVDYDLVTAHSGEEALMLLQKNPDVALILLDVQMPGMDGFEVTKMVKASVKFRHIPIIFITAIHTEDPFVKRGYEVGAVDYFSKPFDPEILRMKVGIYASYGQREKILAEREKQLGESEELLRTGRRLSGMLEDMPVGVVIADAKGRICQTNEEVLRMLNCPEDLRGASYGAFLEWWDGPGHFLKAADGPLLQALNGTISPRQVIQFECLDGSSKAIVVSASPLLGLERHIVGVVAVFQDVSEHRQAVEDIQNRIVKLVSAGVKLDETIARANGHH